MGTSGLALVGFLDRDPALDFLRTACVPDPAADDAALETMHQQAKGMLGAPTPRAGLPDIQDLPLSHQAYGQQLLVQPWILDSLQGLQCSVKLVEIDPLLAFQFHVDTERTAHHVGAINGAPTLDEMLPTCLPLLPKDEEMQILQYPQSVMIRSRSLNLSVRLKGMLTQELAGIHFKLSLPLVHVVRFNGRCYLHNGFHRTYGMRIAGATHVPCIFRDVATAAAAGIREDGGTFGQQLLESADPPTLAHFTQNKALPVEIRRVARVMHVSWAEYVVPEE